MNHVNETQEFIAHSAKWAFSARRVTRSDAVDVYRNVQHVEPGDLVLAQLTHVGQHKKLQLADGRYSESYKGDIFVMVCANRYAPDQFEGFAEIDPNECDMLAAGGIVGRMRAAHDKMSAPTKLRPLGLLTNHAGDVINVESYAVPPARIPDNLTVIGVFGASMNAGKTTAAVSLAHGLKKAGYAVEGVKATGTGAFGDFNAFRDAGVPVSDFTDAGMATTYRMPLERIEQGFETLVGAAADRGADVVVVEIADGVFQAETQEILKKSRIKDRLDAVMFAAPDALGAVGGVSILKQYGLVPFAVSGMVT
ncbi:MAG: hypothetical protein ACR2OM_07295, partial [Aestuariivirgaceae bacterium]